jgi:hypothetical protein
MLLTHFFLNAKKLSNTNSHLILCFSKNIAFSSCWRYNPRPTNRAIKTFESPEKDCRHGEYEVRTFTMRSSLAVLMSRLGFANADMGQSNDSLLEKTDLVATSLLPSSLTRIHDYRNRRTRTRTSKTGRDSPFVSILNKLRACGQNS